MTEINEELIQFSALGRGCCPTVRAKCGDAERVGAGKRGAKGSGDGQTGAVSGLFRYDLRELGGRWRFGARMGPSRAVLRRYPAQLAVSLGKRGSGRNGLAEGLFACFCGLREGQDGR